MDEQPHDPTLSAAMESTFAQEEYVVDDRALRDSTEQIQERLSRLVGSTPLLASSLSRDLYINRA